jgi:23S rRNA (uracil1939-C5)-methyltransferase
MAMEEVVLSIEKIASGGDGIGFIEGHAVFVPFSIPGESLRCRVTESAGNYLRAAISEILAPSPFRTSPACPIFETCGGCNLQHIQYPHQAGLKAESVKDVFRRTAHIDLGNPEIATGAHYGYRNRVQLHFCADQHLGFMESGSVTPVRADGCPVAIEGISDWLRSQNRKSNPRRELQARIGQKERFAVFGQDDKLYVEGLDPVASAAVAGREYRFPLRHFFQSNLEMAGRLADDLAERLHGSRAADLYCGAGLFAARLSDDFDEVACVESDTVSLEAARQNVPKSKANFYARDVESWARSAKGRWDWVVADPPRAGLSAPVRSWIKTADIGGFAYVSCDHATMARDIGDLRDSGWRLEYIKLYDFYPQTGRIEALALLSPP